MPARLSLVPPLAIDIPIRQLVRALADGGPAAHELPADADLFLCVRAAWDAFFGAVAAPEGGEVIVSGLNIPHMEQIVRAHGLRPVAADLRPDTLLPDLAALEAARTPRTVGVLVAQLFGAFSPLDAIADWCRGHGLFLVEDCAQSFMGRDFRGSESATATLFSFGTIKRATALGGAVAFVRDAALRGRMQQLQAGWPVQPAPTFRRKLLKTLALKTACAPGTYPLTVAALRLKGAAHEEALRHAVRGFPGAQVPQSFRLRPCEALARLLRRRWNESHQGEWRARGEAMWGELERAGVAVERVAGHRAALHTFWLLPLITERPEQGVEALRECGLDATRGLTSLTPVGEPPGARAARLLGELVYLPVDQRRIWPLGENLGRFWS